jgi:hypothetical protein
MEMGHYIKRCVRRRACRRYIKSVDLDIIYSFFFCYMRSSGTWVSYDNSSERKGTELER